MAYDEGLVQRVQEVVGEGARLETKKMFGGVGFLLDGNMVCGVLRDDLIVRVGPSRYQEALGEPHVREFDITGRSMKGWVMVEPSGYQEDPGLQKWIRWGLDFASSLPPK